MPLLNLSGICSHQVTGAAFDCFHYQHNERMLNYLEEGGTFLWHLKSLTLNGKSLLYIEYSQHYRTSVTIMEKGNRLMVPPTTVCNLFL